MLAKGNRSRQVTDACQAHGGFYLGSIGGPAARLAKDCITKVEVLEYPELGMEAVFRIEVVDFPAFIVVDDKGDDFFAEVSTPVAIAHVVRGISTLVPCEPSGRSWWPAARCCSRQHAVTAEPTSARATRREEHGDLAGRHDLQAADRRHRHARHAVQVEPLQPEQGRHHRLLRQHAVRRIDGGVGDLHRIGEPTKDRVAFDDAILALDKDLSALKQSVSADPVKVLNNKITLFDTSAKLFTDYGFKECGKN